jgi:predicted component of type VI protein secretion system
MLHHVAPGQVTTLAGKSVVWAAVEDGDEVSIGPYVLRCLIRQGKADGLLDPGTNDPESVVRGV